MISGRTIINDNNPCGRRFILVLPYYGMMGIYMTGCVGAIVSAVSTVTGIIDKRSTNANETNDFINATKPTKKSLF
jgi:hypothetical protein